METKFNIGDTVLIKARVHSIKINKDHGGAIKEAYCLDIPNFSQLHTLELEDITCETDIVENSKSKDIGSLFACCCNMNPKGGI